MLFKECWINDIKNQTKKQNDLEKIKKWKQWTNQNFRTANGIVTLCSMVF